VLRQRPFGRTGLRLSERSFGAWAIGGASYGAVPADAALTALARAEELGCNFVDTAAVYGESEALLGRFLAGRRDRWIIASKYSGQPQGMTALVEEQLRRLGTDCIDLYQIHWAPRGSEASLYAELETLKRAGKIRFAGVSLRSAGDIDHVLDHAVIDALQMPVSLLDPEPLASRRRLLRERGIGVIARSALRGGFLTGKYGASSRFEAAGDQRSEWDSRRIATLARQAQAFSFLAPEAGSLHAAALAYPLSFPEVSTLIVSCKDDAQVNANLGDDVAPLSDDALARIAQVQRQLGIAAASPAQRLWRRARAMLGRA
jgi:aryl-alcohol dehydrogenase-like predicted oxidoreductase